MIEYASREKKAANREQEGLQKILKEILKKYLTSREHCGIIVKLSAIVGSERSLKIEQQEISTKHCEVRNTNLVKEEYILNKVKEAKN